MDIQLQSRERAVSSSGPKPSSVQPVHKTPSKTTEESVDSSALPRTAHWATRPAAPPVQPPIKRKAKVLSLSSLSKPTLSSLPSPGQTIASSVPAVASPAAKPKTPFATPAPSVLAASRSAKAAAAVAATKSEETTSGTALGGRSGMTVLSRTNTSSRPSTATSSTTVPTVETTSSTVKIEEVDRVLTGSPEQTGSTGSITPLAEKDVADAGLNKMDMSGSMDQETTPIVAAAGSSSKSDSVSPITSPLPASPTQLETNGNYQPSVQAQAMVDEVLSRREGQAPIYQIQSPYPDFDDFMECFADGDFTYRLDVKLEVEEGKLEHLLAGVEDILAMGKAEAAIAGSSSYDGVFDPFLDPPLDEFGGIDMLRTGSGGMEGEDAKKKGSRFGFANRSGPPETAMSTLSSLMGPASKIIPDVRAFSQLDMATGRPQENLSNPNYFAGLPGTTSAPRVESEMTPSSKSTMPYALQSSSPAGTHRDTASSAASSMPPPPPGLGGPVNASTFPAYQQPGRNVQQVLEQQMMANMHGYQHQFQADGRRTASPGLQQALRGGSASTRFARDGGYNANGTLSMENMFGWNRMLTRSLLYTETFPFQDPAILRMAPPNFPSAQNRFINEPQGHLYEMNAGMSPYQQQQQPQTQQSQNFQESITPNARLLQAMHEQMGGVRSASPVIPANRSASRQNFAKMY
jgi:hypothetical protein